MTAVATPTVRRGGAHWLRSYGLLVRRDVLDLRVQLVVLGFLQVLMGAGMAVMYGFVLGELDPRRTAYVATGAPVLALIPIGAVLLPGVIAQHKQTGSYDFVWSLPVPRTAAAAATCTSFTVASLPGAAVALAVSVWRYDVDLSISPLIVPAVLLGALMMSAVGYGIGHVVEDPQITNLITNLIIFLVLMYSPIAFPIEQFPAWLAAVHRVLPFHHLAVIVRGGLTDGLVSGVARSMAVVAVWTVAGWAAAFVAIRRRR